MASLRLKASLSLEWELPYTHAKLSFFCLWTDMRTLRSACQSMRFLTLRSASNCAIPYTEIRMSVYAIPYTEIGIKLC